MSGAGIYIKTDSGLVAAATVPGKQGSQGPQSSLVPGTVTTGAAGTSAAATITGAGPVQTLNLTIPKGDPGGFVEASILPEADLDTLTTPGMYYRGSSITPPANWPATGFAGWIEVLNYPTGVWPLGTVQRATSVRSTAGIGASYQTTYWRSRFSTEGWGPWLQGTFVGRPGGADLTGTGSPEGVVTAPVGTYYTDTALTNGAMRWAKKTGTGNTGWKCIEGDTGWRAITSWTSGGVVTGQALSASWAPVAGGSGNIRVRRINNEVILGVRYLDRLAVTDLSIWAGGYVLPAGFRPSAYTMGLVFHASGTAAIQWGTDGSVGRGTGPQAGINGNYAGPGEVVTRAPALADIPWPTTLPGVAN